MFKSEAISKLFNCKCCNQILENPVILPCYETICKKEALANFNCIFCFEEHVEPENGFPEDKSMKMLIDFELNKIDFGKIFPKNYETCKESLHSLNSEIKKLESLETNPNDYIYEYFVKIINQIDLKREELKHAIDSYSDDLIREIKKTQLECEQIEEKTKKISIDLKIMTMNLNELNKNFNLINLNQEIIDETLENANKLKEIMTDKLNEFKTILLNNKTYSFKEENIKTEEIFGKFIINDDLIDFTKNGFNLFAKLIEENREKALVYLEKGKSFENVAKFKEALEYYDKAIILDPKNSFCYSQKAFVLNILKEYYEAIKYYDLAIELKPDHADFYILKGNVYSTLKILNEKIQCYEKAIQFKPNESIFHFSNGCSWYQLENNEEANKCFDKAIELDPNNFEFYENKGDTLSKLKRLEEAVKCFEKAIELKPNEVRYFEKIRILFEELKNYVDLVKYIDKELEFKPNDDELFFIKGNSLFNMKKYEEATTNLNEAIKLNSIKYKFY